jgi:hypothetical protein
MATSGCPVPRCGCSAPLQKQIRNAFRRDLRPLARIPASPGGGEQNPSVDPGVIVALRHLLVLLLLPMATGLFAQTVRQNETASFNEIKAALDERKIEYAEQDLLAEYGIFGKSILTGVTTEATPFLFVFPVLNCYRELAFSLSEHIAAGETRPPIVFLGDAWSTTGATLNNLLENLEIPQNATIMYITKTENAAFAVTFFAVTSFTETMKNPFHLTGNFAKYLETHNIQFSFRDKDIILSDVAISGTSDISDINNTATFLLDFAAASPQPETSPDQYYIAANLNRRKIILSNTAVIKMVLLGSAIFLFVNLFFAVIFNKKRVLMIMLSVFTILAAVFLRNNPLHSPKDTTAVNNTDILNNSPGANPPVFETQENPDSTAETSKIEVNRTVFLDRIIYTIKAAYDSEPQQIAIFYHTDTEAGMPGEVYESPFPYEIDADSITFTLGEYPPNPFETEISFPRTLPGLLTVIATCGEEQSSIVWTEQPEKPDAEVLNP